MFFDTFKQVKKMNEAGFSQEQSEAVVNTMGDLIKDKFVTKDDLEKAGSRVDRQFDKVDHRFNLVDKKFEQVDMRFEQVDMRFEQVDMRFEQINMRFEQVDLKFDQVGLKFDQIDLKFKNLYKSLVLSLGSLILAAPGIYKIGEVLLEKFFHM